MPTEVQNRVECRDIDVEGHWLNEVRLSLLRFVESRLVELPCVELGFAELRFVELRFVEVCIVGVACRERRPVKLRRGMMNREIWTFFLSR